MKSTSRSWLIIIGIVVIALIIGVFIYFNSSRSISYSEFMKKSGITITTSEAGVVSFTYIEEDRQFNRIVIDVYNLRGYKDNSLLYSASFSRDDTLDYEIFHYLQGKGVAIDYTDPNSGSIWSSVVMPILTIGIGIIIVIIFIRQMGASNRGAMDFGRTNAQIMSNVKVRFTDVAGAEEEKVELREIVDFLKSPAKYTALGAKIPKGVLLVGPPGTGKTLFAKAVAGEASVPFFSISGSDFVEMFVGVGASRVRDLFNTAKKNQPCIVFIDEIDAVGRQRGAGLGGGNDEREQTLNQLLVQMDGFEENEGIIIMAATNRADVLDPALLRPGRFDRQIFVNMPDVKGREAILKVHARNKPLAPDVNFKILARMTGGFSGADLANLLNEAAILAARENRKYITNVDLYEGINKVIMGPQKKSRLMTETDKRQTAYHESGHAILAKLLPNCYPVQEVSIIPRGRAGGYTLSRPDKDDNYITKDFLLDELVMTMGGRAAEAIVLKKVTSGPSGDIKQATEIARAMVTEYGMSDKIGPVSYASNGEVFVGRDYHEVEPYSDDTSRVIDEEVRTIINNAYDKAVKLLTENRQYLDVMARVLIERETIYTEEVDMIMEGKSVQEVLSYMEKKDNINPLEKASKNAAAEKPVSTPEAPAAPTEVSDKMPEEPAETTATGDASEGENGDDKSN